MAYKKYVGRTENDLDRATGLAHELASSHDGAKQFHVVEAGRSEQEFGKIYVVDNDGLEVITGDDRYDWHNIIDTEGYEKE